MCSGRYLQEQALYRASSSSGSGISSMMAQILSQLSTIFYGSKVARISFEFSFMMPS